VGDDGDPHFRRDQIDDGLLLIGQLRDVGVLAGFFVNLAKTLGV
jgi:hypothetical protein